MSTSLSATAIRVFPAQSGWVWAVQWSPDGQRIVSSGSDNAIHIWDAASGALLTTCNGDAPAPAVAWSHDGKRIVTGDWRGAICVWDATTGARLAAYQFPESSIYDLAISPDGTRVAVAGNFGTGQGEPPHVRILDLETGHILTTYEKHTGSETHGVAWSPDGALVASAGGDDSTTQIWRPESGETVAIGRLPGMKNSVGDVAWSPDGKRVVASTDIGLHVYDVATGWLICQDLKQPATWGAVWSPNGRWIGAIDSDRRPYLYDPCVIIFQYTGQGHSLKHERAMAFAWAPDSRHVATGGSDGTIHIWEQTLS